MTKRMCSRRMPPVVNVKSPYPLFAVDCDCGMRCLGNTAADAEALWLAHMNGDLN